MKIFCGKFRAISELYSKALIVSSFFLLWNLKCWVSVVWSRSFIIFVSRLHPLICPEPGLIELSVKNCLRYLRCRYSCFCYVVILKLIWGSHWLELLGWLQYDAVEGLGFLSISMMTVNVCWSTWQDVDLMLFLFSPCFPLKRWSRMKLLDETVWFYPLIVKHGQKMSFWGFLQTLAIMEII